MQIRNKLVGTWAFAAAAITAPVTFLAAAPCGLACGGCPLGGACLLSSPVAFGVVLAVQSRERRAAEKVLAAHGSAVDEEEGGEDINGDDEET
jgi:hypothetical protein